MNLVRRELKIQLVGWANIFKYRNKTIMINNLPTLPTMQFILIINN